MKIDLLATRHIGIQEKDLPVMLKKIGVKSVEELIRKTIPENILLPKSLDLPAPLTERAFSEEMQKIGAENEIFTSYIGMGWYDTITPAVV
ncbi:MAG: hypothetical protein PHY71_06275, partial [Bacteroidaceae bacterium]|nr:hypothetical protein [Bacteroidaceae bacterium]